jgi:hypothetical protein
MVWMLEAASIPAAGIVGRLRAKALLAVWLGAFRAWARDDSADMSATMAALDRLLDRAEGLARTLEPLLPGRHAAPAAAQQEPEASSEAASPA